MSHTKEVPLGAVPSAGEVSVMGARYGVGGIWPPERTPGILSGAPEPSQGRYAALSDNLCSYFDLKK